MILSRVALCVLAVQALAFRAAAAAEWVNVSDPLIEKLTAEGKKFGYPGNTAGVAVDRTTGDVFVVVAGLGLFKSSDRGVTFARCDDGKVGGRCETGFTLQFDQERSRLACFMLDGKCGMTPDGGKTWQAFKDVGRNWDYAAVDWTAEKPQVIYAAKHESGGEIMLSTDGGASWNLTDKEKSFDPYGALGVADGNTLLLTKGRGLHRSTDQGKTWAKVSDMTPVSRVMQTFKGVHYFFAQEPLPADAPADPKTRKFAATYESTLIVSKDKGATWARQGVMTDGAWGPYFGRNENHLITLGKRGVVLETTDGGATWNEVVAIGMKGFDTHRQGWFTNLAYDPKGDTFYVSKMGLGTFKYERAKAAP